MSNTGHLFWMMPFLPVLNRVVLAVALVVGLLPVRPLLIALTAPGMSAQQCLLHGADCRCPSHCDRSQQHADEKQAAKPACHRDSTAPAPTLGEVATDAGATTQPRDAKGPTPKCAMSSCGDDAAVVLTAEGIPYLNASAVTGIHPDPAIETVNQVPPVAPISIKASPPYPPPESRA